jgi:hypothetical protein
MNWLALALFAQMGITVAVLVIGHNARKYLILQGWLRGRRELILHLSHAQQRELDVVDWLAEVHQRDHEYASSLGVKVPIHDPPDGPENHERIEEP